MAELEVIYDADKELACIVNVDDRIGWGPAMIGPQAGVILQAFIDTTPFDVSRLGAYEARDAFTSFLDRSGLAAAETEGASDQVAAQSDGNTSMGEGAALAEREAASASDVPSPQPADTDTQESESTPLQVVQCVNCNGTGMVTFGEGAEPQQCGMCKGSGKITVEASV